MCNVRTIIPTTILCLVVFQIFTSKGVTSEYRVVRHYEKKIGDRITDVTWSLLNDNGFQLTYQEEEEITITETDDNLQTIAWTMEDQSKFCQLQASRERNVLFLQGMVQRQAIDKKIEIDEAPWFQASSLSLKGFALSNLHDIEFWTLHPDKLNAYKLHAAKLGEETLIIDDKSVQVVKIELRLSGWRGPFWKSHYWFSASDGIFMRFEGPFDAVGAELMTISFTGEESLQGKH